MKILSYTVEVGEEFTPPVSCLAPSNYDPTIHQCKYSLSHNRSFVNVERIAWLVAGLYKLESKVNKSSLFKCVSTTGYVSCAFETKKECETFTTVTPKIAILELKFEDNACVDVVVTKL